MDSGNGSAGFKHSSHTLITIVYLDIIKKVFALQPCEEIELKDPTS